MVDNNLDGEVIGVAFDGTGYGDDGRIWGGEFFVGGLVRLERIGHLEYVRIPGGDSAIADPWKCALGYLYHAFGSDMNTADIFTDIAPEKLALVQSMLTRNFNVYQSSSAGRLFDAVAAIVGIRHSISFEGQAAIELEQACAHIHTHAASDQFYPFDLVEQDAHFSVTVGPMVKRIVEQVITGHPIESIAMSFHETIARVILDGCLYAQAKTGLHRVVLSGGVFQNIVLLNRVHALLAANDLTVFLHHQVPANDGGLSLGQAALALETLERSR
jgi:hydrogenase maturation protein HypF